MVSARWVKEAEVCEPWKLPVAKVDFCSASATPVKPRAAMSSAVMTITGVAVSIWVWAEDRAAPSVCGGRCAMRVCAGICGREGGRHTQRAEEGQDGGAVAPNSFVLWCCS